jgi:uncharacterized protein YmfQ (DUF2313 family)
MTAPVYTAADFLQALQSLLPRGAVWPRDPDAVQTQTLRGLVQTNVRLNARANNLVAESNPATTLELLSEWESTLGLPDPVIGLLPTIQARRGVVVSKFANYGGQSAAYFINQAALMGYAVTINNNAPFRVGQSYIGQPLGSPDWFFTWTMNIPTITMYSFRTGQSSVGEPLNYWNSLPIGVEISEIKPAHTILITNDSNINNIGVAGYLGFGLGICPAVPAGFASLAGTNIPSSDQYGNYQYTDGSIMVWIPAFYYKYGTGANGFAINIVSIKSESAYANVAAANADGYALHRAFYDNGIVQRGVFVDKYKCSNNAGIASSIKLGNPLSSAIDNNPFSGLTGAPSNIYAGAIAAAKTRGANFFSNSLFIRSALAMLALAHAQASTSTNWCAWYDASGINNFPKGCNNNALGDVNDATLTFVATGNATYTTANKTGSANVLAKTTHNGQNCGVADVNGTMWEICLGLTSDATNLYLLKTSVQMKAITAGNTLATDAWGASGIAANYNNLGATFGALTNSSTAKYFGAATQVFDASINGNAWNASGAGIPLIGGVGGTNAFGNDGLWDYKPNEMCPLVAGAWLTGSAAGVWALHLYTARGDSDSRVGFRAALYL